MRSTKLCKTRLAHDQNKTLKDAYNKTLTVHAKVVGRHEQLQTHLGRDVNVGHILLVAVLVPVLEVLGDLLKNGTTANKLADSLACIHVKCIEGRWGQVNASDQV